MCDQPTNPNSLIKLGREHFDALEQAGKTLRAMGGSEPLFDDEADDA